MSLAKKLDDFFQLEKEVQEAFGYREDWVKIPIVDERDLYWQLDGEGPGMVICHEEKENVIEQNGNHYELEIYTQRFLPKWVYRTEDFTMISVNTHVDGNKYLAIFDNKREVK